MSAIVGYVAAFIVSALAIFGIGQHSEIATQPWQVSENETRKEIVQSTSPTQTTVVGVPTTSSNASCPQGTVDLLQRAGIHMAKDPKFPICYVDERIQYNGVEVPIYYIAYDERPALDSPAQLYIFAAAQPSGELKILSDDVRDRGKLYIYLTNIFDQPFGIPGLTVDSIAANKELTEKNSQLCFRYTLKYPFDGIVEQCPTLIEGSVAYAAGGLTWNQAEEQAVQECKKRDCMREPNASSYIPDRNYPPFVNAALKSFGSPHNSYYVFISQYRNGGEEGVVAIKIYLDGKIESAQVHTTGAYDIDYILKKMEEAGN